MFQQDQSTLNAWKTEMKVYQKNKRTKKPFGSSLSQVEHVTHEKVKAQECKFNPILQTYTRPDDEFKATRTTQEKRAKSLMNHLKQTVKYEKQFDIVNLKSNAPFTPKEPIKKLGPIRNAFNVINNQKLPDFYFEKREIRIPLERSKKLLQHHTRDFNILTNTFKKDHQHRIKQEIDKETDQIYKKYAQTHSYDPVYGKFYDPQKEVEFQNERKVQEKVHGKDTDEKLPPSYVHREPLILDYSKPLPQTLRQLDQKNNNAKKRFQTKYIVLDEYQKRNIEEQSKQEAILKNHVHFGRVLDEKCKEFDIITNYPYKQSRAEDLYGKKLHVESWDTLLKEASQAPPTAKFIKTSGFK